MIASNIFRLIGDFFTWTYSWSFDFFRLETSNWWSANAVNWVFVLILIVLLSYWMRETLRFKRDGVEDKA